jgi:predicted enzyme related to lactoylglutathione lyase
MGARIMVPPTDIPNIGRFAILNDPQGADFAVIRLEPRQQM